MIVAGEKTKVVFINAVSFTSRLHQIFYLPLLFVPSYHPRNCIAFLINAPPSIRSVAIAAAAADDDQVTKVWFLVRVKEQQQIRDGEEEKN